MIYRYFEHWGVSGGPDTSFFAEHNLFSIKMRQHNLLLPLALLSKTQLCNFVTPESFCPNFQQKIIFPCMTPQACMRYHPHFTELPFSYILRSKKQFYSCKRKQTTLPQIKEIVLPQISFCRDYLINYLSVSELSRKLPTNNFPCNIILHVFIFNLQ